MTPRPRPAPLTDPLADLRLPEPGATLPEVQPAANVVQAPVLDTEVDMGAPAAYDALWHEDAVRAVMARWHGDLIAVRALHHGGSCPCHRLARIALLEAVGLALPPVVTDGDAGA